MNKNKRNYYELIRELAFTDFKLKYQGSVLGYFWSLAKPLMLFLVLYVVFAKFFKIGSSIEYYPAYLLLGVVIWGFFTEITATSLDAIVGRGDLIRKVFFPRIVLVISRGTTSLITFCLNLVAVLVLIALTGVSFKISSLFFPLLIIETLVLTVGIALILSSLFVKFRDLGHIWEVALQILFYATPILYPLSFVPQKVAKVLLLSPIAQIIQDSRYILITKQTETTWSLLGWRYAWIPYALTVVIFILGYWLFQKSAAKFAEEI